MAIGNHAVQPQSGHEPTVTHALEHLVEATQGVIKDQLELARIEVRETVRDSLVGAAALLVGGVFLLIAWTTLSMATYVLLIHWVAPWASLCIVAGVNLAIGAAVAAYGGTRLRQLRA